MVAEQLHQIRASAASLDAAEYRKNPLPLPGIEPPTIQLAAKPTELPQLLWPNGVVRVPGYGS
jgi:hypothetical protein